MATKLSSEEFQFETSAESLEKRFMEKVCYDEGNVDGCWEWMGYRARNGYGTFGCGGRSGGMKRAHRVAYELFQEPIPDGLDIDHLCGNRGCVNPSHLEPVTRKENIRRVNKHGSRVCRQCEREKGRRREAEARRLRNANGS